MNKSIKILIISLISIVVIVIASIFCYKYITNNSLCINTFISDYKEETNKNNVYEENGAIILETKVKNENVYNVNKKLYIDQKTGKPIKMEIQDITQNLRVYILYNKVEINTLQEELIFNV